MTQSPRVWIGWEGHRTRVRYKGTMSAEGLGPVEQRIPIFQWVGRVREKGNTGLTLGHSILGHGTLSWVTLPYAPKSCCQNR